MAKFYKFPRSYRNRNKIRKPVRKKDVILLIGLCYFLYCILSSFFIFTLKIENSSMEPAFMKKDVVLVSSLGYYGKHEVSLERGDVVLLKPSYYREIPFVLKVVNSLVKFFTFQKLDLVSKFGYESGYVVKRIIALPGEEVMMKNNQAFVKVRGSIQFVSEKELLPKLSIHISDSGLLQENLKCRQIEKNKYFVLSDNRDYISDSRSMPDVDVHSIQGKILCPLGTKRK